MVLLLTTTSTAHSFLRQLDGIEAVQNGEIAFVHMEPTDMLTYDVLQLWRYELVNAPSKTLGPAFQSLIIITALPGGTLYDPNSDIVRSVSRKCPFTFIDGKRSNPCV